MARISPEELRDIVRSHGGNKISPREMRKLIETQEAPVLAGRRKISREEMIGLVEGEGIEAGPPTIARPVSEAPLPEEGHGTSSGTTYANELRSFLTQAQQSGDPGPFASTYEGTRGELPPAPERAPVQRPGGVLGADVPDYVTLGREGKETPMQSRQRIYGAWENGQINSSQLNQALANLESENEFIQRVLTEKRLFEKPARKTAGRLTSTVANIIDIANFLSKGVAPLSAGNVDPYGNPDVISVATKKMRLYAQEQLAEAHKLPDPKNLLESLVVGAQEVGPMVLEFMTMGAATKLAGPPLGAVHGLISNSHNEQGEIDPKRAAKGATMGYLMFKALGKGEKMPDWVKPIWGGGVFAGFPTAVEMGKAAIGMDYQMPTMQQAMTDFLLGAALGLPESRSLRVRDELRRSLVEDGGMSKAEAAKVEKQIFGAIKELANKEPLTREQILAKARSKVGGPEETISEHVAKKSDRLRQAVLDDLHGIQAMDKPGVVGTVKELIKRAYNTARLTRGRTAVAEGTTKLGRLVKQKDGSWTFEGKSLEKILEPVAERLDDFLLYMAGRRAETISKGQRRVDPLSGLVTRGEGRKTPWSAEEIKVMKSLETPEFKQAAKDYAEWNKANLDFAVEKGIISPEARARFDDQTYVPFYRIARQKVGKGRRFRGIQALRGGEGNVRDLLQNMLDNNSMLIESGITNEAYVRIVDAARMTESGIVKPANKAAIETHRKLIEADLIERGATPEEIADYITNPANLIAGGRTKGSDLIQVFRNGKSEYWQVEDKLLFRAMQSLNRPMQNEIVSILSRVRGVGQKSVTFSAEFIGANMARDTVLASIMSQSGFRPILDTAIGLRSRMLTDAVYKEYIANGGGIASYHREAASVQKSMDAWFVKQGIDPMTVMNTGRRTIEAFERLAEATEMATRLGEYRRARKKGVSAEEAALRAREISVDFAMRGDSKHVGWLYDTALFLKAGINGTDRIYRGTIKDPNRKAVVAKATLIAALSAQLHMYNKNNPLYDELSPWDKDTNWHFFIPKPDYLLAKSMGKGDQVPLKDRAWHRRMPRLWEVGAGSRMFEISLDLGLQEMNARALGKGKPVSPEQFKESMAQSYEVIAGLMNYDFMPFALRPLYDVAVNKKSFFGTPIETQSDLAMKPWVRGSPTSTSRTMRRLMEPTRYLGTEKWPEKLAPSAPKVEALFKGYLNTWAVYGLNMSDWMIFDDQPAANWDRNPMWRRFVGTQPARSTRFIQDLYDVINEANKTRATARYLARTHRPELAGEEAYSAPNMLYKAGTRAEATMSAISNALKRNDDAPTLKIAQKVAKEVNSIMPKEEKFLKLVKENGTWEDINKLKRAVEDSLLYRRNNYARDVMTQIKDTEEGREEQLKVLKERYDRKLIREQAREERRLLREKK